MTKRNTELNNQLETISNVVNQLSISSIELKENEQQVEMAQISSKITPNEATSLIENVNGSAETESQMEVNNSNKYTKTKLETDETSLTII